MNSENQNLTRDVRCEVGKDLPGQHVGRLRNQEVFLPFKNSEELELDTAICTLHLTCVHGAERVTSDVSSGLRESRRTGIGPSGGQMPTRAGPDKGRPQTDRLGPVLCLSHLHVTTHCGPSSLQEPSERDWNLLLPSGSPSAFQGASPASWGGWSEK